MRFLFPLLLLLVVHIAAAQRYEVVIHEIFADPTPSVGLPNYEWIELCNRSRQPVSLLGWRIQDAGGQSAPLPNITLLPDSLLIVCSTTAAAVMNTYGKTIGVSGFPSLDNEGELLVLRTAGGQVAYAIEYSVQWHGSALKKEGGWSLEMIDTQHPGWFGPNWSSSLNTTGGTPGKRNSIAQPIDDRDPPQLINAFALDSSRVLLQFDEALDSAAVSNGSLYGLSAERNIIEARSLPPLYDRIELKPDQPLLQEKTYTLSWKATVDLDGNRIGSVSTTRIGIPSTPDSQDLRINELLFDPPPGGTDYVEMIHIGKKIVDLSRIYLASRGLGGSLGTIKRVSEKPRYVFPGDHVVLTADPNALNRFFFVALPDWVTKTEAIPSLPDTEGSLVLLNDQGQVIDEVRYSSDWHFPLLRTKTGVALERIDPNGSTQDRNNWQSAASTVGYGTPTRRNSQYRLFDSGHIVELSSHVLSPNGDGRDDILQIKFRSETPANQLRIRIFHASGVAVRELANLAMSGTTSVFNWDGLDDRGRRLPTGQYIVLLESTDLKGRGERFKKVVTLTTEKQ